MTRIRLAAIGVVLLGLIGCSAKQFSHETTRQIINKQCENVRNCEGEFGPYHDYENILGQRPLVDKEENARLAKVQREMRKKKN